MVDRATKDFATAFRRNAAAARVPVDGTVETVSKDSSGFPVNATIRLDEGNAVVPVALMGKPAREGQRVRMSYARGREAGPDYTLDGYLTADGPTPWLDDDLTIPAPTWGIGGLTSVGVEGTGGLVASVTAHLVETPEKHKPKLLVVEYATDADAMAGQWSALSPIPNVTGEDSDHIVTVGSFGIGTTINVRARTQTITSAWSPASDVRSVVTAADIDPPTAPGPFSVDLTLNLTAKINLPSPTRPDLFQHWEVSIAESAGGLNAIVQLQRGSTHLYTASAPRTIYLRIREVTRIPDAGSTNGFLSGPWRPVSTWDGPHYITSSDTVDDITPPSVPVIATATAAAELIQGTVRATITVTLAAYSKPADFAEFEYQFHDGVFWDPRRTPETLLKYLDARGGITYQVRVRAWDTNSNASAWSANSAVPTPAIQQPPTPGAAPTVAAYYRGALLSWAATPETTTSGRITHYQVQRAPDSGGTPGVWADATTVPSTATTALGIVRHVDVGPLSTGERLPPGTRYHWRYRPVNSQGQASAAYSPSASAVTLAVDNGDFLANTIIANQVLATQSITAPLLAADLVLASTIRANGIGGLAGRIFAGTRALLYQGGLAINNAATIFFRSGDLETGTDVATIGVVANYQGGGKSGVLIESPNVGTPYGVLFIRTKLSEPDGTRWVEVSDQEIRFRQPGGGFAMTSGEVQVPSGARGGTIVRLTHQRTVTGAGTLFSFAAGDFGIPSEDRHTGIMCRITNLCGAGSFVYLYPFSGDQEEGLFATDGATVGGFAPCNPQFGRQWSLKRVGGTTTNIVLSITAYVA